MPEILEEESRYEVLIQIAHMHNHAHVNSAASHMQLQSAAGTAAMHA